MNEGFSVDNPPNPNPGDTIRFTHSGLDNQGTNGAQVWVVGIFHELSVHTHRDGTTSSWVDITPSKLEGTQESVKEFFGVFLNDDGSMKFANAFDEDFEWEVTTLDLQVTTLDREVVA